MTNWVFRTFLRPHVALIAVGLTAGFFCACSQSSDPKVLVVAAAANLESVSKPLAAPFEGAQKSKVTFSFGSSGQLEQQIRQGAPFDVYMPAELYYCESLRRDGFLEGEISIFALGKAVAWSQSDILNSLEDLVKPEVRRVALANPKTAPYGLAAQQALEKLGLWQRVQPKLVYAENVSQAFQMAKTGNTEVALTALPLVKNAGGHTLVIDSTLHSPIQQCAAAIRRSENKALGRVFVEFLTGAQAQAALEQFGYGRRAGF